MPKTSDPVIFTVSGVGEFPFDMLRRDEAYPVNHDAVAALSMQTTDMRIADTRRHVRLATHRALGPTVGRWESFGWKVLSAEELEALEDAKHRAAASREPAAAAA